MIDAQQQHLKQQYPTSGSRRLVHKTEATWNRHALLEEKIQPVQSITCSVFFFTCWSARHADHWPKDSKRNRTHPMLLPQRTGSTNRHQWSNLLDVAQPGQQSMNETRCPKSILSFYPREISSPSIQASEKHDHLVS